MFKSSWQSWGSALYLPRRNSLGFRYFWVLAAIIFSLVQLNFFWTHRQNEKTEFAKLREKAQVLALQFIAMRSFIAQNQDRINFDSAGNFEFKYLNPAAVGRGVGNIFNQLSDYSVKQTRLQARNPANEPDDFERAALVRFAEKPDLQEYYDLDVVNGDKIFRYLVPLYVEPACLSCHGGPAGDLDVAGFAKEGLREGDLAGAISISVPMDMYYASLAQSRNNLIVFSVALFLVTLAGILYVTGRLVAAPLEALTGKVLQVGCGDLEACFDDIPAYGEVRTLAREFSAMVGKLKDMYNNMERKVASRTRALEAVNLKLKEREEALRLLNQKLTETNRLKDEFLTTITHELRTPLTSIVAFCELLLDGASGELNEEQRENLLDIQVSAQQLTLLINDILDLAKLEAGTLRLVREKFDLNHVFYLVRRGMAPLAYQNGLVLDVDGVALPLVCADLERQRQILSNLVSNAVKFNKPGGRIHVSARADEKFVTVTVEDDGYGISPEFLPHIFEKFRQGDASMKRRRSGTGLGLALVKLLVEMQGGSITVTSKLGEGSCFTYTVPVAEEECCCE